MKNRQENRWVIDLAIVDCKTAVKTALAPIMAEAAALCHQLGESSDTFYFTQQHATEQLAEIAAWASQVVNDTASQGAFERAESLACQTQMNDSAAADERQTNSDAEAVRDAIGAEADAWATAENASIDADNRLQAFKLLVACWISSHRILSRDSRRVTRIASDHGRFTPSG